MIIAKSDVLARLMLTRWRSAICISFAAMFSAGIEWDSSGGLGFVQVLFIMMNVIHKY